jgi:hypothetical protein
MTRRKNNSSASSQHCGNMTRPTHEAKPDRTFFLKLSQIELGWPGLPKRDGPISAIPILRPGRRLPRAAHHTARRMVRPGRPNLPFFCSVSLYFSFFVYGILRI